MVLNKFEDNILNFSVLGLAALLILNMPTIYLKSLNSNYHLSLILEVYVCLFLILLFLIPKVRTLDLKVPIIIITFYLIFILVYFMIGNKDYLGEFLLTYMVYIPVFFLINYILLKLEKTFLILEWIYRITVFLSILSFILWIACSVISVVKYNTTVWIDWGQEKSIRSFHNIHFETQAVTIFGKNIVRNTGIFCEAPMYAYILLISIFYDLLLREKSNKLMVSILIITIFSTLSTTGIVMVIGVITFKFAEGNYKNELLVLLKKLVLPIVTLVLGGAALYVLKLKMTTGSYLTRMDDINGLMRFWSSHIFLGNGFNSSLNNIQMLLSNRRASNTGLSSGFFVALSETGIYLVIIHVFYLVPIGLSKNKRYTFFCVAIFFLFLVTLVQYRPLYLYILTLCYTIGLKKEK